MTSSERFEATCSFQPVDRVLLDYHGEPETDAALRAHLGSDSMDAVLDALGTDLRRVAPTYVGPELPVLDSGLQQDVWGVIRQPVRNETGTYMEPLNRPWADMASPREVADYPWPTADMYDFSEFPALCEKHSDKAVFFGRAGLMDLINGVSFGRGFGQVLLDIATRDQVGLALFEKRFEFMFEFARRGLEAGGGGIDILFVGEDLGTQRGLVISPDTWGEMFRPYLQQMIDLGRRHGARVMMHSCGSVVELIPRFIDMGLDILQAVQPQALAMAPSELAARFGGRLVFNGTMDVQGTLPYGSPVDVRREVRARIDAFRDCGGLILGPCHHVQTDTPVENILAMYDEANRQGPTHAAK